MDAETRHQLKTNELGDALSRIDLNDRRFWGAIAVVVVLLGLYTGWKVVQQQAQKSLAREWETLAGIQADASLGEAPVDQLRSLISEASSPGLEAAARLRLGVTLEKLGIAGNDPTRFNEAATELQQAADNPAAPAPLRAAALYRLACVHESRQDLAAARASYQKLIDSPEYAATPFKSMAEARLGTMDGLDAKFAFEPGLPPAPPPDLGGPLVESQPASVPAAPEAPSSAPAASASSAQEEAPAPAPELDGEASEGDSAPQESDAAPAQP